jgi:hypothetical protein
VGLVDDEPLCADRKELLRRARNQRAVALGHRHRHQPLGPFVVQFPAVVAPHRPEAALHRHLNPVARPIGGLGEHFGA